MSTVNLYWAFAVRIIELPEDRIRSELDRIYQSILQIPFKNLAFSSSAQHPLPVIGPSKAADARVVGPRRGSAAAMAVGPTADSPVLFIDYSAIVFIDYIILYSILFILDIYNLLII